MIGSWLCVLAVSQALGAGAARQDVPKTGDGVPIISWRDAAQFYDKEAVVYGRIVLTRNIGNYTFLNFHREYRLHFTILIKKENYGNFPEPAEKSYDGKFVAVRGKVLRYRDKPEIVVSGPAQLVILPDDAADLVAAIQGRPPAAESVAGMGPGAAPRAADHLTVATMNLGRLFLAESALCRGEAAGQLEPTPAQASAAQIIRGLNADVVAVQRAGDLSCLARFNKRLLGEMGYQFVAGVPNPQTAQLDCAILSRYPLDNPVQVTQYHTPKRTTRDFKRPLLEATVQMPADRALKVVVVSLPVQDDRVRRSERSAEVRGVRQYIDDEFTAHSEVHLTVCGGFGDTVESGLLAPIVGHQRLVLSGYRAPADPQGGKPGIAQVEDFILSSAPLAALYHPGSTRIERGERTRPAVAVTFDLAPPPAPAPAARPANPKDDF